MALIKNDTNEYLRITGFNSNNNTVEYTIYMNSQIRENEKNNIPSEITGYSFVKNASWNSLQLSESILTSNAIENKNIIDSIKTLCYQTIAEDSSFANWQSDEE